MTGGLVGAGVWMVFRRGRSYMPAPNAMLDVAGLYECVYAHCLPVSRLFVVCTADHKYIRPKSIHSPEVLEGYSSEFMYVHRARPS